MRGRSYRGALRRLLIGRHRRSHLDETGGPCDDAWIDDARIPIRFGRLKPLLVACGLTPKHSYLDVGPATIRVRLGWGFRADIPRSSIGAARRVGDKVSIGAHGWRGRWLVNGAGGPLVALRIEPPARARAVGFPIVLRELIVSVDDPDGVVRALQPA